MQLQPHLLAADSVVPQDHGVLQLQLQYLPLQSRATRKGARGSWGLQKVACRTHFVQ